MGHRAADTEAARRRVLAMVERRTITAAEAAELIGALDGRPPVGGQPAPAGLRVRVTDLRTGRIKTDVTIPAPAMGGGRRLARRLRVPGPGIVDEVTAALRSGRPGLVASCANDHGERVELFVQ